MKHIVSFSGGKDSTAMLLLMIEKGMPVDEIIFVDTGLEFPEMYEYIDKIEKHILRPITRIKAEKGWDYWFYRKKEKGNRIGETYGWPFTIGAWCNDRLKLKPLHDYEKKINEKYMWYIGIAADEEPRYARIQSFERQKAPLYEWGITEQMAREYLEKRNLLNPLYKYFDRLGCYLCPKQNARSLRTLYDNWPDLWQKLLQYDDDSSNQFKVGYTAHDFDLRFRKEDMQGELNFG